MGDDAMVCLICACVGTELVRFGRVEEGLHGLLETWGRGRLETSSVLRRFGDLEVRAKLRKAELQLPGERQREREGEGEREESRIGGLRMSIYWLKRVQTFNTCTTVT